MHIENVIVVNREGIVEVVSVVGDTQTKTHAHAQWVFIDKCKELFGDRFHEDMIEKGSPMRCTGLALEDEDLEGTTVFLVKSDSLIETGT